jgi:peptidoglycan hydrolase-like protein with peptidoglycan-binding domain
LLASWSAAWADPATESAQQKLKDSGFYFGEINGKKDADTTAAIRRYQIRNGLQITGELNTETQHSLGLGSKPTSTPATRPAQPPTHPAQTPTRPAQTPIRPAQTPGPTPPAFLEETPAPRITPAPHPQQPDPDGTDDDDSNAIPEPPAPRIESTNLFANTPYEAAPPQVQQDIVSRAQMVLLRQGYYRDEVDGFYGPAMNFALRNYQARFGLRPSGRLDVETLAALNLLPEQQRTTGFRRFPRRLFAPHIRIGPGNEPIYIPR